VCGEGAVLGHRSAAALWGLVPAIAGTVVITVAGSERGRKRPGIELRQTKGCRHEGRAGGSQPRQPRPGHAPTPDRRVVRGGRAGAGYWLERAACSAAASSGYLNS
jgi:hypothetical protein